jgi:molecular chaperone GrpE
MNPDETPRNSDDPVSAAGPDAGASPDTAPANENLAAPADAEALAAELADAKDKLLRALAEVENVRRRAQRDREDATRYAISGFARDMLGVADNLRRAIEAITPEARAVEAVNNLAVGVEMTEAAMLSALERNGVTPIDAVGQPFDPNRHEALYEVPDPTQPSGTVAQMVERGYMLRDRLLRPAKVGVAKGGPRAAPHPDAADASGPRGSTPYDRRRDAGGTVDEEL